MSDDQKGWLLLLFLYCSDLGIKIFEKEMFCASWGIFYICVLFFFRDYTAPGGMENAIPSNMKEIGKFYLNIKKVVVFAKMQIHQK